MKQRFWLGIIALFIPLSVLFGQNSDISILDRQLVWEAYRDAAIHEDDASSLDRFYTVASAFSAKYPENEVGSGFIASAQLMKVEGMTNLIEKFESFMEWKTVLEGAINAQPEDADLRLFRLSVQLNVPSLLRYSNDIEVDSQLITQALNDFFWESDPAHEAFIRAIYSEFELTPQPAKNEY